MKYDDGNLPGLEGLLVGDALIDGQQNVESSSFGGREEVAILESREAGVTGRLAVVTGRKFRRRSSMHSSMRTRIQGRASNRCFASSNAARASSRETVGNPVRNSSRDSPPSR